MKGYMNSLTMQALLVLWVICSANGAPYSSEYKRFNHRMTVHCGGVTQRVQKPLLTPPSFLHCVK
jgi:hypothetical protein